MKTKNNQLIEYVKSMPLLIIVYVVLAWVTGWAINELVYGVTGEQFTRGYAVSFGGLLIFYVCLMLYWWSKHEQA